MLSLTFSLREVKVKGLPKIVRLRAPSSGKATTLGAVERARKCRPGRHYCGPVIDYVELWHRLEAMERIALPMIDGMYRPLSVSLW